MDYRIKRVDPSQNAIEHGLFGKGGAQKGSTWDNHLYIARQKVGDGWRYFYTQAELRAAQAKQAGQKAANRVGSAVKSVGNRVKTAAQPGLAKVKRKVETTAKKASDAVNNTKKFYDDLKNYSKQADEDYDRALEAEREATNRQNRLTSGQSPNRTLEGIDRARRDEEAASEKVHDAAKRIQTTKYSISSALNKVEDKVNKGKTAASKLLSNAKSATSDAASKGKSFMDGLTKKASETSGKVKSAASEAAGKVKETAANVSNKAQEGIWEAKRNVEEFADKAKNFATNKTYRNDKTYRDMVDGVSSMKQDLKSVNAYIDELRENGTNTAAARKELRENIELRRQIEDSLDFVQDEIDKYEKNK